MKSTPLKAVALGLTLMSTLSLAAPASFATEYTRVYIRRLRAKLEDGDEHALIATEPRAGYRMALPTTTES